MGFGDCSAEVWSLPCWGRSSRRPSVQDLQPHMGQELQFPAVPNWASGIQVLLSCTTAC